MLLRQRTALAVFFVPLLLVLFSLLLAGCGMSAGGGGDEPPPYEPPDDPDPPPDGSISPLTTLIASEVTRSADAPSVHFWLVAPDNQTVWQATFCPDTSGNLPPAPVAYELGASRTSGSVAFTEGLYTLHWQPQGEAEQTREYTVSNLWQRAYVSDAEGNLQNFFEESTELVALHLEHLPVDKLVTVYVVADRDDWSAGESLLDVIGSPRDVFTGTGNQILQLWGTPVSGRYDVVVDMDRDGELDDSDLLDGATGPGFVVGASRTATTAGLASDATGEAQTAFESGEAVYCTFYPVYSGPLATSLASVPCYIVAHNFNWQEGATLADVEGYPELIPLQPDSRAMTATLVSPGTLPDGAYDLVLDLDGNGLYDEATDVVDDGSASGNEGAFIVGEPDPPGPDVPTPPVSSADVLVGITWTGAANLDIAMVSPTGSWCNWLVQNNAGMRFLGDVATEGATEWIQLDAGEGQTGTYGAMVSRRTLGPPAAEVWLDIWTQLGTGAEQHFRLHSVMASDQASWKATGIAWPDGGLQTYPPAY